MSHASSVVRFQANHEDLCSFPFEKLFDLTSVQQHAFLTSDKQQDAITMQFLCEHRDALARITGKHFIAFNGHLVPGCLLLDGLQEVFRLLDMLESRSPCSSPL